MFSFLKKKLKKAVDSFGKQTQEEAKVEDASSEEIEQTTKQQTKKPIKKTPQKKPLDTKTTSKKKAVPKKTTITSQKSNKEEKQLTQEKKGQEHKEPIKETHNQKNIPQTTKQQEFSQEEKKEQTIRKEEEETEDIREVQKSTLNEPAQEEKKSFFGKIKEKFTKVQLSEEKFDELFWDLELAMLENNVAIEVIEKIKEDLRQTLTTGTVTRRGVNELIHQTLHESVEELFIEPYDLLEKVEEKKPYVIAFIGVNGSGKTTTLAKVANLFQTNNKTTVMAASDTFRAAAIDQLQAHANTLGVKLINQGYGADPAAVAYDAIEHAKAKNLDVVMIDTAGRLHSNNNLMAELEKVIRVAKPDLKIFIGESITGNDCVEQAQEFNKRVGIDAIILSKADIDEKGGAALSVSYVTQKPILYLGVGQAYGDLEAFDKERIIKSLGL